MDDKHLPPMPIMSSQYIYCRRWKTSARKPTRLLTNCLFAALLLLGLVSQATGFSHFEKRAVRIIETKQGQHSPLTQTFCDTNFQQTHPLRRDTLRLQLSSAPSSSSESSASAVTTTSTRRKSLHPQIGDVVRYYDLDGGKADGQVLVGRITFIFGSKGRYIAEITQLEDVQDGYYAEYSSSKRMGKKTERLLLEVSPVLASYVQSEQAYKVPMERDSSNRLVPKVRQATYDLDDYEGPVAVFANPDVLERDQLKYQQLKSKLLKNSALFGLVGTVLVNVLKGTEDAAIYFAGVVGSLLYLLFLSLKTDTIATGNNNEKSRRQQMGSPFANLRFFMPVLVLVGVSLYNQSRGESNPLAGADSTFDTVTQEQFAAAVLGFLTYRVPLFVGQVQDAFAEFQDDDGATNLAGSAGVALKALQASGEAAAAPTATSSITEELATILLVSGPQATGRSELVKMLLEQDERLVAPQWMLRRDDGATFERLERRGEFLAMDATSSAMLTKDSIFAAAGNKQSSINDGKLETSKVVVVDASVDLAKKLQYLAGVRLIGVWVGLPTVSDFEQRIEKDIADGTIMIPEGESKESVIRARIKEIINEIEYGLSSGIFEFTILNQDPKQSVKELKQAAAYAFK
jgi:guanylate kinase